MSGPKQQEKLYYFEVFVKMRRMNIKQQYFADLFDISPSAVSQALRGEAGMGKLLTKIDTELDKIQRRRENRASKQLRSVKSPFECRHTPKQAAPSE